MDTNTTINDINDFDYEGEEIVIGKKTEKLKYIIPSLKFLSKKYGSVVKAFNIFDDKEKYLSDEYYDTLINFIIAGTIKKQKDKSFKSIFSYEELEEKLTYAKCMDLSSKVIKAFFESTPHGKQDNKNDSLGK